MVVFYKSAYDFNCFDLVYDSSQYDLTFLFRLISPVLKQPFTIILLSLLCESHFEIGYFITDMEKKQEVI